MAVTVLARWSGGSQEEFVRLLTKAKAIMEGHGAEQVRGGVGFSGVVAGDWMTSMRFANWETFGKAMEAAGADPAMRAVYAEVAATGTKLVGRSIINSLV